METASKLGPVEKLLEEIRDCEDCKIQQRRIPVVYGTTDSRILVISEVPPKPAWDDGLGEKWRRTIKVPGWEGGVVHEFCKWLNIVEDVDSLVFWIQRANCCAETGQGYVLHHCSYKFIPSDIQAVKPRLVITLGHLAAQHFLQLNNLSDVVGRKFEFKEVSVQYTLVPMFHPSRANKASMKEFKQIHEESMKAARPFIDEAKRTVIPR